jgi:flagellar protein FliS
MYRTLDVMTDSPGRCIVKLYQHLAVMMRRAKGDLERSSLESAMGYIDRARATIEELICALDFERGGEIAKNLARIYGYMLRELLAIGINRDPAPLGELVSMTEELLGAWIRIVDEAEAYAAVGK